MRSELQMPHSDWLRSVVPSIYSSARPELDWSSVYQHHAGMISSLVPALISAFKVRRELALENVTLREQLAVLHHSVKRPLVLVPRNPLVC